MTSRSSPLPRESSFSSRLRDPTVTARVGMWLGICFSITFLTGLWSHWAQDLPGWLTYPTSPVWLYRLTQGVHVASGTAAVPLLLVKLWSVYPRLFAAVPRSLSRQSLLTVLERLSIAALVAAAVFQLVTGLMNSSQWYPWGFSFRDTHYAVAWVAIGSLALHVAVKLPVIRRAFAEPVEQTVATGDSAPLSRRGLLRATWAASALAVLATAGASAPWLRRVSVFGVRSGAGPQGLPVNRSAEAAGVLDTAEDSGWRLQVSHPGGSTSFTREQLLAMPQRTAILPIACVEGWSATGEWTGVPLRDVLARVGVAPTDVTVSSLQTQGSFASSFVPANVAADSDTLLALKLSGQDLHLDHGYPLRLIAPARPGVLQTKWLNQIEVQA
jgi:DMSO/TMAO reductase YedYZ molybdopterin-dependent catalytic subunit